MSYIPHSDADVRHMLDVIGVGSIEELFAQIPQEYLLDRPLDLPPPLSEWEVARLLSERAAANESLVCFAGGGLYDHYVPAVVDQILRRSEFYTAYTPYQPEVSQGTLQAIYEFQSMICELTGMDAANASMYDGATATAEAMLMSHSVSRGRRRGVVIAGTLHPHYRQVIETYNSGVQLDLRTVGHGPDGTLDLDALRDAVNDDTAAVIVQSPNFYGIIEDWSAAAEIAHAAGALLVAVFDPVSLALLKTPGECGADIAVGEGQGLGNALSFGGPALGLFACRMEFVRQMPGRIAGATVDENGRRGYVLTLQTREQHIRRERATSNICTNHALNALAATVYLAAVGRAGLQRVAETSLRGAHYAFERITALDGFEPLFPGGRFFKEFAVRTPRPARELVARARQHGILAGIPLDRFGGRLGVDDGLLIAVTEKRSRAEIDRLVEVLAD
ncbi:MAG TPA: aminomethyl-transferring glycine dehydrogenase subunit GcvPA [Longimicrobiales bacterium]|nr:aminomethyl-transferring glycine dehydrogenase subunit GcvPA [Longimicrobiales bacterium]